MDVKGEVLHHLRVTAPAPAKRKDRYSNGEISQQLMSVAEVCKSRGLNPAEAIVDAITSGELDLKTQAEFAKILLEYVEPKRKAIEHSGSIDLSLPDLLAMAEDKWRERGGSR